MNQAPGSTDTIYSLINFRFDSVQFGRMGEKVVTQETENCINKSSKNFHDIIKIHQKISYSNPPDVGEIYRMFMRFAPRGYKDLITIFDSSRKIRKLAYSLGYKEQNLPPIILSNHLNLVLELIESKWKYSMFDGLFDVLLKYWCKLHNANGAILRKYINEKLSQCTEDKTKIYRLKKWANYFTQENGPIKIANNRGLQPGQMCALQNSFPFSEHMKGYEYLSEVVVAFTNRCMNENLNQEIIKDILDFLKKHNDSNTNKRCLSKIIITINDIFFQLQDVVKDNTLKLIGDPANSAYWQPWTHANDQEIKELKAAQTILNEWLTKQFITIFFEKIANFDSDRKLFWLQYVKHISHFKIYGNQNHYRSLTSDERIKNYVPLRFGSLFAGIEICALVLVIKNYIFVEFSQTGNALYAYLNSNRICPDINKKSISISELKHTEMDLIFNRKGNYLFNFKTEGRFSHIPTQQWGKYLSQWIESFVGVTKDGSRMARR